MKYHGKLSCKGLLTAAVILGISTVSWAQETKPSGEERKPPAHLAVELQKRGLTTKVLTKDSKADLTGWPKDSATGAKVRRITGPEAGLSRDKLPGAKFVGLAEIKRMEMAEKSTGLYLVDVDFVPRDVLDALKAYQFTLKPDGTLLAVNGEPVLALVTSEVYLIERKAEPKPDKKGAWLDQLYDRLTGVLVPTVQAASPFPWVCYSFTPWAIYHEGFHRWYDARTWAGAYGPDSGGGCSGGSPYTHIDYIQTRAAVSGYGDEHHCFFCETEYSRDTWDVGYWWPAHGTPTTFHLGVWADGWFSFSRTAQLTW